MTPENQNKLISSIGKLIIIHGNIFWFQDERLGRKTGYDGSRFHLCVLHKVETHDSNVTYNAAGWINVIYTHVLHLYFKDKIEILFVNLSSANITILE